MTFDELSNEFAKHSVELRKLVNDDLPKKIGVLAVSLFKKNFREESFFGEKWKEPLRKGVGTGASANRKTLTGTGDLGRSIQYVPGNGEVTIFSDLEYSAIHNEGGTTHPRVTPKMRRYMWAMFYKSGGGKKKSSALSAEAEQWKSMAITKQEVLTVHIPQRQFLGYHDKLQEAVNAKIDEEVNKTFNTK